MTAKSINQLNSRLRANQTIAYYNYLGSDAQKYSPKTDWRNKYYTFKRGTESYKLTITGNFIFGAAMREFERLIERRHPTYLDTTKWCDIDYEIDGRLYLQFRVTARLELDGVYMQVQTNFSPMTTFAKHYIRSNDSWDNFDPKAYFLKRILPKYMYMGGLLQKAQILFNIDKAEAKEKYIAARTMPAKEVDRTQYLYDGYKKLLKKKKIILDSWHLFTYRDLKKAYDQYPIQKRRAELKPAPSLFALYDQLSYEHDTEDGLMNAAADIIYDRRVLWV